MQASISYKTASTSIVIISMCISAEGLKVHNLWQIWQGNDPKRDEDKTQVRIVYLVRDKNNNLNFPVSSIDKFVIRIFHFTFPPTISVPLLRQVSHLTHMSYMLHYIILNVKCFICDRHMHDPVSFFFPKTIHSISLTTAVIQYHMM